MFLTLAMKEGGNVKFGDNQSGKIIGTGTIGNASISINNVWLVVKEFREGFYKILILFAEEIP